MIFELYFFIITHYIMNKLTSKIWSFFTLNPMDDSKANCNVCKTSLSRGAKDARGYGTTSFIKHLKTMHPSEFKEFSVATEATKKTKGDISIDAESPL